MSNKLVHGYAWVTHPDVFGLDVTEVTNPGHPFAFGPGEVSTPAEVVFFRPASSADAGVRNEFHAPLVPGPYQDSAPSQSFQRLGI